MVKHVQGKWYGALSNSNAEDFKPLLLVENQSYTRSAALGTRDLLFDIFKKSGLNVKVYEEDSLEPDHQLSVVFYVLGANTDNPPLTENQFSRRPVSHCTSDVRFCASMRQKGNGNLLHPCF